MDAKVPAVDRLALGSLANSLSAASCGALFVQVEALMTEKLSDRIEAARTDHAREYPDGDWRAVNDRFSKLFFEAAPILRSFGRDPLLGGNEGRAEFLRGVGL